MKNKIIPEFCEKAKEFLTDEEMEKAVKIVEDSVLFDFFQKDLSEEPVDSFVERLDKEFDSTTAMKIANIYFDIVEEHKC